MRGEPIEPGTENNLASCPGLDPASALKVLNARGTPALEQHLLGQDAGFEAQIVAVEDGLQERARRRPAKSAFLVDMEIAHPGVVAGVEIGGGGDAHLIRRLRHGIEHRPTDARLLDAPLPAGAMMLALTQEVVVEAFEHRKNVVPTPSGEAQLSPVIVVRAWPRMEIMALMAEEPPITLPRGYLSDLPFRPVSFSVSNIQSERGLPMANR